MGGPSKEIEALELDLGKLSSDALKTLSKAVDMERKRRGKRNPANHAPPAWPIPKVAVKGSNGSSKAA